MITMAGMELKDFSYLPELNQLPITLHVEGLS